MIAESLHEIACISHITVTGTDYQLGSSTAETVFFLYTPAYWHYQKAGIV